MNKDLQLLCEIGFAGVRRGIPRDASVIFETLSQMRPENACGAIGQSLIEASRGSYARALEILDAANRTCTEATHEAGEIRRMIAEVAAKEPAET